MIVDDEYIVIGSANINQRSLAGDRDSELAIGAHQVKTKPTKPTKPNQTKQTKHNRTKIHLSVNDNSNMTIKKKKKMQPRYGFSTGHKGEVHKFRMSLWEEHTKLSDPLFLQPQSKECVALV